VKTLWKLKPPRNCSVEKSGHSLKQRALQGFRSHKAAEKVRLLKEWKEARIVFVSPDCAQQKVREYALLDGKVLVMASPKLKHGCVVVDPKDVKAWKALPPQ
jgi:5-formyltetrahydrofolate cyclo-ligase